MAKTKEKKSKDESKKPKKGKEVEKAVQPVAAKKDVALLKEIIELGGTAEDLALVAGLDSDAEQDGAVASGSNTKKAKSQEKLAASELSKFISGLGFEALQREDVESEQEIADSELEEDSEEEDSEPSEIEEETPAAAAPVPPAPVVPLKPATQAPPSPNGWLLAPQPLWHAIELPQLPTAPDSFSLTVSAALEKRANELLTQAGTQYTDSLSPKSKVSYAEEAAATLSRADKSFIITILQSGTSSDKLSALTLLASSSPVHCTAYLSQLLALCGKKNREESTKALRSVVDWLKGQGLPGNRKLKWFADQKLRDVAWVKENPKKAKLAPNVADQYLLLWAFEHWLKKWYLDLLRVIETMVNDPLPFIRTQMVGHLYSLLTDKPEQEHNLLILLANKLGDTNRPLASLASYNLLQLLQTHPNMKPIVIREVAGLVLKPAPATKDDSSTRKHDHARYYGLITLNQIMLAKRETAVAGKLIEVYFEVFGDILKRIDAVRMPDEPKKNAKKGKKVDKKELAAKAELEEEGDSKLLAAVLTGVNRAFPFADLEETIMRERMDTLFKITHTGSFNVSVQALSLIFNVVNSKNSTSSRFYSALYASLLDPRLADSSKQTLYLNLLFRAINIDTSMNRIMAFVKRLLQTLSAHSTPYIIGSLHLLGELFTSKPALASMLSQPEDEDQTETFKDVPDVDDAKSSSDEQDSKEAVEAGKIVANSRSTAYDWRKRDPVFANAQTTCLWELVPLLQHFHPSVRSHAAELLAHRKLSTTQDLEQHTLTHFLDRFVYRDPKKAGAMRGVSAMQPAAAGHDRTGRVLLRKGTGLAKDEQMNSEQFWRRDTADVPPDQVFFHSYFVSKHGNADAMQSKAEVRRSKKRDREGSSEAEAVEDADPADANASDLGSEGEDEVWRAMKASMPKPDMDDLDDDDDPELEEDDEDISLDMSSDEEVLEEPTAEAQQDSDDDDGFEGFAEEPTDLLDSDVDMNVMLGGSDDEADQGETGKDDSRKRKKRKLKHLPLFGSAEDYAKLLGGSDDEDI